MTRPAQSASTIADGITITVLCLLAFAAASPASALAVAIVLYASFALSRLGAEAASRMNAAHLIGPAAIIVFIGIVSAAAIATSAWWPALHARLGPAWPTLAASGLLLAQAPRPHDRRAVMTSGLILLLGAVLSGLVAYAGGAAFRDVELLAAPWLADAAAIEQRAVPGIVVPTALIAVGSVLALRNLFTRVGNR